jgi:hypothetical protein
MKNLLYILLFVPILFVSSCEKSSRISCPDVIQNVDLIDFPMDLYGVNEVEVLGEQLLINVTYGGGCEDHEFELIMNNENPIDGGGQQIEMLYLSHNANNDVCFSQILEHHLCFDISNLLNDGLLYFYHPDSLYDLN